VPLVRIDAATASNDQLLALSDAVHAALVETIGIPADDRFHVLTNGSAWVVADPGYLGIERDKHVVIIQVLLRAGRDAEKKRAFYAAAAEKAEAVGIERRNLVITLVENASIDWSFGDGIAQYEPGIK
jgi:hypothetical protein